MLDPISQFVFEHVIDVAAGIVMPIMLGAFFFGAGARLMLYYLSRLEGRFAHEFEKRVRYYFATPDAPRVQSFYRLTRILLEKTFFECFELRDKYKRRSFDYMTSLLDRIFLKQDGMQRLVEDTLRQIRYFRKDGPSPKMVEVAKVTFENNPYFNRLLGVFPVGLLNDLLSMLPGLFLIGGIFGTFLGISKGLPELGSMDLGNLQETKRVMDLFLVKISQAMVKSIIGIGFSATMSVFNTLFSVEGVYYNVINRYSNSLEHLWNETTTNEVDKVDTHNPPRLAA